MFPDWPDGRNINRTLPYIKKMTNPKVIDFEYSCVTHAVLDFSYAFSTFCISAEDRKAFAHAYLIEMGMPAASEDVFALVQRLQLKPGLFRTDIPKCTK